MVRPELLQRFKVSVKTDYGVDINDVEAEKLLECWTNFFDILAQIDFAMNNSCDENKLNGGIV